MATTVYGLTNDFAATPEPGKPYEGAEIDRLHNIIDSQLSRSVRANPGIYQYPDADSLKVTAGTGRDVFVEPGLASVVHPDYGPAWVELDNQLHITGLEAGVTRYLFASLQVNSEIPNDSRETATPTFLIQSVDTADGGVLLAELQIGTSTVTVIDRREESLAKFQRVDIHGQTAATTPAVDDELLVYDASAGANRRMTRADFLAGVGASPTPTGTGFIHVTSGVQDNTAKLVGNADVDAAAAIAESKLALASDAAANVASRRTLGSGGAQAAPGNHAHPNATGTDAGFMAATDKTKLNAATAAPSSITLVLRDTDGRAQVAAPAASGDIANKAYVDGVVLTGAPDADEATKGIARLSVAPEDAPVAVGDNDPRVAPFVASGAGHGAGLVPDPGSTEGSSKTLHEDGLWKKPAIEIEEDGESSITGIQKIIFENAAVTDNEDGSVTVTPAGGDGGDLAAHLADTNNPHSVTKSQVGLGNVDNTSDLNKPISTATQTALDGKQATAQKGQASGYAGLDAGGRVPVAQLPGIVGRGNNLVANGYGEFLSTYNFSAFDYDALESRGRGTGVFKKTSSATLFSDELIPIDTDRNYRLTAWAKTLNLDPGANYAYIGLVPYDADGRQIASQYFSYVQNSHTTLAADLEAGDTVIELTSAVNWKNADDDQAHRRQIIFWKQTTLGGWEYPPYTYSRQVSSGYYNTASLDDPSVGGAWAGGGISGNTITLRSPWPVALGNWPAGTLVSNNQAGGTYPYVATANAAIPAEWTKYTGIIGGVNTTGAASNTQFPPGTVFVRIMVLCNRTVNGLGSTNTNVTAFTDISLMQLPSAAEYQSAILDSIFFDVEGNPMTLGDGFMYTPLT